MNGISEEQVADISCQTDDQQVVKNLPNRKIGRIDKSEGTVSGQWVDQANKPEQIVKDQRHTPCPTHTDLHRKAAANNTTAQQDKELQELLNQVPAPKIDELVYFIPEPYVVVQKLEKNAYRIEEKAAGYQFLAQVH